MEGGRAGRSLESARARARKNGSLNPPQMEPTRTACPAPDPFLRPPTHPPHPSLTSLPSARAAPAASWHERDKEAEARRRERVGKSVAVSPMFYTRFTPDLHQICTRFAPDLLLIYT
jgi:hypothetical protein